MKKLFTLLALFIIAFVGSTQTFAYTMPTATAEQNQFTYTVPETYGGEKMDVLYPKTVNVGDTIIPLEIHLSNDVGTGSNTTVSITQIYALGKYIDLDIQSGTSQIVNVELSNPVELGDTFSFQKVEIGYNVGASTYLETQLEWVSETLNIEVVNPNLLQIIDVVDGQGLTQEEDDYMTQMLNGINDVVLTHNGVDYVLPYRSTSGIYDYITEVDDPDGTGGWRVYYDTNTIHIKDNTGATPSGTFTLSYDKSFVAPTPTTDQNMQEYIITDLHGGETLYILYPKVLDDTATTITLELYLSNNKPVANETVSLSRLQIGYGVDDVILQNVSIQSGQSELVEVSFYDPFSTINRFNIERVEVRFSPSSGGTYTDWETTSLTDLTVSMNDTTAPTISGDSYITSDYDTPESVSSIKSTLTATDDVDGDLTANIMILEDNFTGNENALGNHTIKFEVSDASGNTAQHTITVSVQDSTPATISLNGESVVYKEVGSAPCAYSGAYATDNVDGTVQLDGVCNVDTSTIGTYTIEFDYTDSSGNVSQTKIVTVHVEDTTAPYVQDNVTSVSTYDSALLSISELLSNIVVVDGYDQAFDGSFTITADNYTANKNVIGNHTVIIQASDAYGNVMNHTITIEVMDDLAPVISGQDTFTSDIDSPITISEIKAFLTASDDVDGDLTDSITVSNDNFTANQDTVGSFIITFSVTDSDSQTSEYTVTINTEDRTAPTIDFADFDSNTNIIRVPTNATISDIRSNYLPQNFIIIDGYEGTLTESAIIFDSLTDDPSAIDTSVNGDYAQIIRVSDSSGNTAELHYTIRVQDMTAPVFDAPSEIMKKDTYILSSNFFLSYFTVTDNIDGDLTDQINIVSNEYIGNADTVGSYEIVLSVQDNDGNTATHTLTITVKSTSFSYLIIDNYKWIVPNNANLTDLEFVQELKRINDLPDDNFVFTSVSDTYTANASENGSYQKTFSLSSGSGESYSREINISVVDPNTNLIEDDATFWENAGDILNGGWIFFKRTWWMFLLAFLVGFGIYQNKK